MEATGGSSGEPTATPTSQSGSAGGDSGPLVVEGAIFSLYHNGIYLLSNYGWYILLCLVVMVIVWANIKPTVQRWLEKREKRQEELNFDPVKAEKFQDGMLKAREKMQRDLEEKAMEHQAVMEERKAKERDEKIKQWEEFKVVTKSKSSSQPKPQDNPQRYNPPPRRDYFPLGGGGGGGGYRPARRNVGGGG